MAILVTNDDGYTEGLDLLLKAAKKIDPDSYAIIPNRQRSAVAMSLTLHKPLRLHKKADSIFELSGTPADCVLFGLYSGEFKKPSLVLSGVNFGDNSCLEAIIGSGTIGACWEAALQGFPSVAFSLFRSREGWKEKNWGNKGAIEKKIQEVLDLLKGKLKDSIIYSVNIPSDPSNSKILFSKKIQKKRFSASVEKRLDPSGFPYYWISGDFSTVEAGTDLQELAKNNNITISAVSFENLHVKD